MIDIIINDYLVYFQDIFPVSLRAYLFLHFTCCCSTDTRTSRVALALLLSPGSQIPRSEPAQGRAV